MLLLNWHLGLVPSLPTPNFATPVLRSLQPLIEANALQTVRSILKINLSFSSENKCNICENTEWYHPHNQRPLNCESYSIGRSPVEWILNKYYRTLLVVLTMMFSL